MENVELQEKLLSGWISLNGELKDTRLTQNMTYNEAIIMRLVLERYRKDGEGKTAVQQIIKETHMLKSLVNRTVNTLCDEGYLCKIRDSQDKRNLFVMPMKERLPEFLNIHNRSLQIAQNVIEIIGEEDAKNFVRICEKIAGAGLRLP